MENTEIQEVTTLALAVPDQAKQLTVIANNDDYIKAGNILLTIKDLRKKIEASYKKIKQTIDAEKKTVLEEEREQDKPLLEAENWIKPLISSYLAEQEKIRKAEEDRLREQARLAEEERQLQAALAAEQSGNKEDAQAIIDEPVYVPPIVVQKSVPKVAGISMSKQWKYRIVDINKIPREYMMPDEKRIGGVVTKMQGQVPIPGVEIYVVDVVSAGRR